MHVEVENLSYALRRYDDSFKETLAPLDALISQIHGELFSLLNQEPDALKAYLTYCIVDRILVPGFSNPEELVAKLWIDHNLQHNVRVQWEISQEELLQLWADFQNRWPSDEERLLATIKLCGRRLHYARQHQAILKAVRAHNKQLKKADRISLTKIQAAFATCSKLHSDYKAREERNENYCHLTGCSGRLPPRS